MRVTRADLERLRAEANAEQEALLEACCAFIELAEPVEVAFLNTAIRTYGRRIQEADHSGIGAVMEAMQDAALRYRQGQAKPTGRAA